MWPPLKYFKYYVGLNTTTGKLRKLLQAFPFTTLSEVLKSLDSLPRFELVENDIRPAAKV